MGRDRTAQHVREELLSAQGATLARLIDAYSNDERATVRAAAGQARGRLRAERREARRLAALYRAEEKMVPSGVVICAGLDEVGRGALAGPVTAAAVVLPRRPRIAGLNDSKALSPQAREEIAADIRSVSLGWAIAHVGASEIDSSGIVTAVRAAMRRALAQLAEEPEHVLVDGDRGGVSPSETAVVRGDATVAAIAAASIVAKVARDTLMREMALLYPGYSFAENKGYGTSEHLDAIGRLGLSSEHRRSFAPCGGTQPLF